MRVNNLFLNTRSLTSSKEDHLTEFLAALITMNEPFRLGFSALLLDEYASRKGWQSPRIKQVETQISYPGTNCCPDMRFTLEDGHILLCENKIEALETKGSSIDPRGQLLRYLDLPTDGVAYIRATPSCDLDKEVAGHGRFVTRNGHHFLWRDIYPLLLSIDDPLVAAVRRGFEVMGFLPPLPAVGTLSDFNAEIDKQNRAAFKELWQLAADYGRQRGWKADLNVNGELYFTPETSYPARQIFVSPSQAERFLVRFTLRKGVSPEKIRDRLAAVVTGVPFEITTYSRVYVVEKVPVKNDVVDITSSLANIIAATEDREEIKRLLRDYVTGFVSQI